MRPTYARAPTASPRRPSDAADRENNWKVGPDPMKPPAAAAIIETHAPRNAYRVTRVAASAAACWFWGSVAAARAAAGASFALAFQSSIRSSRARESIRCRAPSQPVAFLARHPSGKQPWKRVPSCGR